jgi:hypothetical protein
MVFAVRHLVFRGCPKYFRVVCLEASCGALHGYDSAGRELARHIESHAPDLESALEWEAARSKLDAAVRANDRREVERWYVVHYPSCMRLVPRRRRAAFVRGVISMLAERADAAESQVQP